MTMRSRALPLLLAGLLGCGPSEGPVRVPAERLEADETADAGESTPVRKPERRIETH